MISIFKPMIAFSTVTFATFALIAAPNPKLVPDTADMVLTCSGLNNKNDEAEKAWIDGLRKLDIDIDTNANLEAELNDSVPGLGSVVAELFGYSKDTQTLSADSFTCFLDISPSTTKGETPDVYGAFIVHNPKANLSTLKVKIDEMVAKQESPECKVVQKGDWLHIQDDDTEQPIFFGICATAEGYRIVAMPTFEKAEAYRKGEIASLASTNPLKAAFKPVANKKTSACTWIIKEIAKLITDTSSEADLESIKAQAPWALQANTLTFKGESDGTTSTLTIALECATEATAQELSEMLIGYKALVTGMILPMSIGTPDSKTGAILKKVKISTTAKTVTIALSLHRDEILASLAEIKELQERAQAEQAARQSEEIKIEGLDELLKDDDNEDSSLTPEEAEKILDALD